MTVAHQSEVAADRHDQRRADRGGGRPGLLAAVKTVLILACLLAAGMLAVAWVVGVIDTRATVVWGLVGAAVAAVLGWLLVGVQRAGQRSLGRLRRRYPDQILMQAVEVNGWTGALLVNQTGCRLVSADGEISASWDHADMRTCRADSRRRPEDRVATPVVVVRFHRRKSLTVRLLPPAWTRTQRARDAAELAAILDTLRLAA